LQEQRFAEGRQRYQEEYKRLQKQEQFEFDCRLMKKRDYMNAIHDAIILEEKGPLIIQESSSSTIDINDLLEYPRRITTYEEYMVLLNHQRRCEEERERYIMEDYAHQEMIHYNMIHYRNVHHERTMSYSERQKNKLRMDEHH
jgi:hypothetical protein